jgi:hypothetical protein
MEEHSGDFPVVGASPRKRNELPINPLLRTSVNRGEREGRCPAMRIPALATGSRASRVSARRVVPPDLYRGSLVSVPEPLCRAAACYRRRHTGKQRGARPQHVLIMHLNPCRHSLLEEHTSRVPHNEPKLAHTPLPSTVSWQAHVPSVSGQTNLARPASQFPAHLHSPPSRGVPPFLRHLRRWRRVRASAVSADPMPESAAPSTPYPAHFSA